MNNVIDFPGMKPRGNVSGSDMILKWALMRDLAEVTIIGLTREGKAYYSSTLTDAGHIVISLEELKRRLVEEFGS